jgi:hypothetical protein
MPFRSHEVSVAVLEKDLDVACVIEHTGQIVYCNPAWDEFAAANSGSAAALSTGVLGRNLMDFIPPVLKPFYAKNLLKTPPYLIWDHNYECSTPSEFRIFRLQALRLKDTGEILLVHSLQIRRPHTRRPMEPPAMRGQVAMCAHCRRTHAGTNGEWLWTPEFIAHPPEDRADSLCRRCADYYDGVAASWTE